MENRQCFPARLIERSPPDNLVDETCRIEATDLVFWVTAASGWRLKHGAARLIVDRCWARDGSTVETSKPARGGTIQREGRGAKGEGRGAINGSRQEGRGEGRSISGTGGTLLPCFRSAKTQRDCSRLKHPSSSPLPSPGLAEPH